MTGCTRTADDFRAWESFIELSELQLQIRENIGVVEHWVRVEIESHRISGGHHYLNVLEKGPDGSLKARASARIWRFNEDVITRFAMQTGQSLNPGISVVVLAEVDYHPVYGLSLNILDIDSSYSIGLRELERKETIRRLTEEGLVDRQKALSLSFLPSSIAVISSQTAAGYGDFVKHLSENPFGFRFQCTLYPALMQGENAPASISSSILQALSDGPYDVILLLRGGGAESDLFCFDDYGLCRTIAESSVPILTAIGHERDHHIADMVANDSFKTPTALADFLVDWVSGVESAVSDSLQAISREALERINEHEAELCRCVSNIRFMFQSSIVSMEHSVDLLETRIRTADPRSILEQGYVLAVGEGGALLRSASSKNVGERFSLRFMDGRWTCRVEGINKT